MLDKGKAKIGLSAGLLLALAGCGTSPGDGEVDEDPTTLRIGHITPADAEFEPILQDLNEELQEKTDGRVVIETYPDGQLGGEVEMLEQIDSGNIEGGVLNSGPLSTRIAMFGGLELPYLWEDEAHAYEALTGEVGDLLTQEAADEGMVVLAVWGAGGFTNISNNVRPIQSAEDAEGISIRVLENQTRVDTFSALGMDPTPLPFPEVFTALQQGVVDGVDGGYNTIVNGGFYEIQSFVSEVQMILPTHTFVLSDAAFEQLSEEDQQILQDLVDKYTPVQWEHSTDLAEKYKETASEAGIEIIEVNDLVVRSFRDLTSSVVNEASDYSVLVDMAHSARD